MTDEEDKALVGSIETAFTSEVLNRLEGGALMRRKTCQSFCRQGHWPAEKKLLDNGITRTLCVVLPPPAGARITRRGIAKSNAAAAPSVSKSAVGAEGGPEGVDRPKGGALKGRGQTGWVPSGLALEPKVDPGQSRLRVRNVQWRIDPEEDGRETRTCPKP